MGSPRILIVATGGHWHPLQRRCARCQAVAASVRRDSLTPGPTTSSGSRLSQQRGRPAVRLEWLLTPGRCELSAHRHRPGDCVLIQTWEGSKSEPPGRTHLVLLTTEAAAERGRTHHTRGEGGPPASRVGSPHRGRPSRDMPLESAVKEWENLIKVLLPQPGQSQAQPLPLPHSLPVLLPPGGGSETCLSLS